MQLKSFKFNYILGLFLIKLILCNNVFGWGVTDPKAGKGGRTTNIDKNEKKPQLSNDVRTNNAESSGETDGIEDKEDFKEQKKMQGKRKHTSSKNDE